MVSKELLTKPLRAATTSYLFAACKSGNLGAVKKAVQYGADINALKNNKVSYSDAFGGDTYLEGYVYETPMMVAAREMKGKPDTEPYKQIIRFLGKQPKLDTSRVAVARFEEFDRTTSGDYAHWGDGEKEMSLTNFFNKYSNLYEEKMLSQEAKEALKAVLDHRTAMQKQLQDLQVSR